MTVAEIREAYLKFFEERGHARIPSASLVPENDPTTLFTGSGMQPLVLYLLGQPHPKGKRLVNSQRSFRVKDIDEVGDNRHTTYFEMLGNWSLGDYFKVEQLSWAFEFLTEVVGLDPKRLYVTVFKGRDDLGIPKDEVSARIWKEIFARAGLAARERIFYYDATKNWWSRSGVPENMPVGELGGPDSEIFWDFGVERKLHEQSQWKDEACHVNCDCGRYLEIGNSVFMEYKKTESGFVKLPKQNVDFGGGLERIAAAQMDLPDIFALDIFIEPRVRLEAITGKKYAVEQSAFRIIMDHLRAAVQLLSDGVVPSNKDHGYVARRLIRRAIRRGDSLGITTAFVKSMAEAFGATETVVAELVREEERFRQTLRSGLRRFSEIIKPLTTGQVLPGGDVFNLYQSYGFPFEMTEELAQEKGLSVDQAAFAAAKKAHQQKSRVGAEKKFQGGLADHSELSVKYHTATHLLHKALQVVLGPVAVQKGSNITPERLRFDFVHGAKLSPEEIKQVEDLVNEKIRANLLVTREELTVAEARERGAMGLFEHKYGEKVSVYTIGDFSCEICGGPHVDSTGTLGVFKIMQEESVGVGARRIKAVLI